jgi:hypothetical protein
VELCRELGHVRLRRPQQISNGVEKRCRKRDADQAIEQIADREPVTGGIVAVAALKQRIDRAAEICFSQNAMRSGTEGGVSTEPREATCS